MPASERDRRALMWGGIGVGAILLWIGVAEPLLTRWERAGRTIAQARRELDRAQHGLTAAVRARETLAELEQLAWVFPDEAAAQRQTALLIQELTELPSYRRIRIEQIRGQPTQQDKGFTRARVSVQFRGQPAEVLRWLAEMENHRPRLVVDGFTLRTSRDDPDQVEGEMQIVALGVVVKGARS